MRLSSWVLSILIHAGLLVLVLYTPLGNLGLLDMPRSIYTVDIVAPPPAPESTDHDAPKSEPHAGALPHQPPPPPPEKSQPQPRTAAAPPETAPDIPRTEDTAAQSLKPAPRPIPSPDVPPGTKAVSPVKKGSSTPAPPPSAASVEQASVVLEQGIHLRLGDTNQTVVIKEGAETRTLRMLAVRDYTIEEYSGHYVVSDDRFMSVIDGREAYDSMLFYDSGSGLYRKLFKFGGMIYTYGPTFNVEKPTDGSITFLTTKEGVSNKDVLWYSRILWMPEGRTATFGTRIYFQEEPVRFKSGYYYLTGLLIVPPASQPVPAVVWYAGKNCVPLHLVAGFARMLASMNIAVLIVQPAGCGDSSSEWWDRTPLEQADDLLAAGDLLKDHASIDPERIGVWGFNEGDAASLEAAARERFDFLVLSYALPPAQRPPKPPARELLPRIAVPTLTLFAGQDPVRLWASHRQTLHSVESSTPTTQRLVSADSPQGFPGTATFPPEPLIYRYAPTILRTAGSWIQNLPSNESTRRTR